MPSHAPCSALRRTLTLPAVLVLCGVLSAQLTAVELPTFTEPKQAGADFQVQGEYLGKVGGQVPIGIQVIAVGKGQFEGVLYAGGLPGQGWDRAGVFHVKGKSTAGETRFHGAHGERLMFANANFSGVIKDNAFRGTAHMFHGRSDDVTFHLKKVERRSPTLGSKPPRGAIVLFDGSNADHWRQGKLVDGGLLAAGTTSKRSFGSFQMHMEFQCPFMPTARGMKRGNSGVYIKREWEVQIVDSFGWHHENRKFERLSKLARCGGIHEMIAPRINMSFPPLAWQTFDIEFTQARLDQQGRRVSPAQMTVRHNGVLIHDKYVLPPVPPGHAFDKSTEGRPGPIYLQEHGNPVRYRNIWILTK